MRTALVFASIVTATWSALPARAAPTPAPPTAEKRAEWQTRCDEGNERACREAALLWLDPTLGVDAKKARAAVEVSCKTAPARCFILGRMKERGVGGAVDLAGARAHYKDACRRATDGKGLADDVALFGGDSGLVRAACRAETKGTSKPEAYQPACDALEDGACVALRDALAANTGPAAWPIASRKDAPPFVRSTLWRFAVCGVRKDTTVECFTRDGVPLAVPRIKTRDVAVGEDGVCLVRDDGKVACVAFGGMRVDADARVTPPAEASPARRVRAEHDRFCAVTEAGALVCWQPGRPERELPQGRFEDVVLRGATTCGVPIEGPLVCTGPHAAAMTADTPALAGKARLEHLGNGGCTLKEDGQLMCFGRVLHTAPPTSRYRAVSLSSARGCVVDTAGALSCFLSGAKQTGPAPAPATSLAAPFSDVTLGDHAACVVDMKGALECVGEDAQVWRTFSVR